MQDIIIDTIKDNLKIIPYLFIAFLIIELFEHRLTKKSKNKLEKTNKFGPIIGSIAGILPQCGFSVIATNLYVTRIITLGTLFSVYLSTSDEMLPILFAHKTNILIIIKLLFIKFIIGIIFGYLIDKLITKKDKIDYHICTDDNCHCKENIISSVLKHTFKTIIYIFIITFILNILFYYFNEDYIKNIINKHILFAPFITSLIGLIPNCGPSVIITELFLNNVISLGSTIAGLLTNGGLGLLVLFKSNKNIKENMKIVLLLYFIGVIVGLFIEIINYIV